MSYQDEIDKQVNYSREKAIQIARDISSSLDHFFNKETDSKFILNLIKELETTVSYTAICLFKEKK